jgi:uncharacterized membrane protein YqhA
MDSDWRTFFLYKINMTLQETILLYSDADNIFLVAGGFFWCFIGIFLRKLQVSVKEGKSILTTIKETPIRVLLTKVIVVIAAMRFFKVIFDTDQIAFAGFIIGLSLDILPDIILSMPNYFTSKFEPFRKKHNRGHYHNDDYGFDGQNLDKEKEFNYENNLNKIEKDGE